MKSIFVLILSLVFGIQLFAQEKYFRVEQILLVQTRWDNTVDTIVKKLVYEDSKLEQIVITKNSKEDAVLNFTYTNDKVEVHKAKWLQRSVQIGKDGKLTEFWSDGCDKFTLSYSGNQIQNIDRFDKCDKYSEGNICEYKDGKLSKVKTYNKKGNAAFTTDYLFTYENGQLTKLVWGNEIDVFQITRNGDKITKIEHAGFKRPDWKHEFVYDDNGNIIEETVYTLKDGKESISEQYYIMYAPEKGNDYLIWSAFNWKYNLFLNQRTYKEHIQMRY